MGWVLHNYGSNQKLVEDLTSEISRRLRSAIDCRKLASLAVSGGSTPAALFDRLCNVDIEWDKVYVTLVDERWVDEESADSNAGLVKSRLLTGRASDARFTGLKTDIPDPFLAIEEVNERLRKMPLPFDIIVLGMGEDGHTASFFAGSRGVEKAMDPAGSLLCCAVEPVSAPYPRMTLALPTITTGRNLYLHIVGTKKRQVLEQAIVDGPGGSLPIGRLLHDADTLINIYFAENL